MSDLFENEPVPLSDMIACVEREIAMRERVYPRWVESGRMTQDKADWELRVMRAVLVKLRLNQQDNEDYQRRSEI